VAALANFDLNLARVFVAVYQEKSLTRAGERLNLTQSAVSHALSRLRASLGDRLFERSGAVMLPTALARDAFPGLEAGLRLMEAALADGGRFDPARSRRIFRLGMNDYSASIILPPLMARLRREAPGVRLRIRQTTLEERRAFLTDGTVELMTGCDQDLGSGVSRERLFSDRDVVVVPKGHPALSPGFGPKEREATPIISLSVTAGGDPLRGLALEGDGRVALAVEQELAIPRLCEASGCAGRMSERLALALGPDGPVRIARGVWPEPAFDVFLYRRTGAEDDPGVAWLRERIVEEGAALDGL